MPIELTATTEQGARLVADAERLADEFATRAAHHDRESSYPFASIEALHEARYFAAAVPVELGGRGVTSVHDLVVAASRLARGDASVAIGVNMHTAVRAEPHAPVAGRRPYRQRAACGGVRLHAGGRGPRPSRDRHGRQ